MRMREKTALDKSFKIIDNGLIDIMSNETVRKEFNKCFRKGAYRNVDEFFEVQVHNRLYKLLEQFTMKDEDYAEESVYN